MADYPIRTREQAFLAAIAGEGEMPTPKNRKEAILAKAGGVDVDIEPKTANEYWTLMAFDGKSVVIKKQTVTTVDNGYVQTYGAFGQTINAEINYGSHPDAILVTFNGHEYLCEADDDGETVTYGGTIVDGNCDFSTYPFIILIDCGIPNTEVYTDIVLTQSAETVTIKAVEKAVEDEEDEEDGEDVH